MNYKINLLLAQSPSVRFIRVSFGGRYLQTYTYKAPANVNVGDTVVVDTPANGFTFAIVDEILELSKINLDAKFEYKWIIQVVDTTSYKELKNKEALAVTLLTADESLAAENLFA